MKQWKCPDCKRVRVYEKKLVMMGCACGGEMEVVDERVS